MHPDDKRNKVRNFKAQEKTVRAILNEWDPIAGSLKDEYDSLVHNLLSLLHRSGNHSDMKSIIQNDVTAYFGFEWIRPEKTDLVAKKIWDWWTNAKGNP